MDIINDTIAAISTAPGYAGIAIIRVSGPSSIACSDAIFKCHGEKPSQRPSPAVIYGHVISGDEIIDECLLLIMRAPHSYTREDIVEFQCHGGAIAAKRIFQAILKCNVRIAEPGEFTKRAFLNGRLDLVQAEAVYEIIRAQSDAAEAMAIEQLNGVLSSSISAIYEQLLDLGSDIEFILDFPDNEQPKTMNLKITERLKKIVVLIDKLLNKWEDGHVIRDGALVVICGPPNAGKSTLLNALLGKDRAIVSPIPGTTRDYIEEQIVIEGTQLRIVDTAGLGYPRCSVELDGMKRSREFLGKADVILAVLDCSKIIPPDFENEIKVFGKKRCLVILNKTDLVNSGTIQCPLAYDHVSTQAIYNKGITEVIGWIIKKLHLKQSISHKAVISERHKMNLKDASDYISKAINISKSKNQDKDVLLAQNIADASQLVGEILGRNYTPELLDNIFKKFCVGK
jgi:tRNA modification GTPase